MSYSKPISTAESVDHKFRLLALAVFLFSLVTATEAIGMVVDEQVAKLVDHLGLVFLLSSVAIAVHLMWWKFRVMPKSHRHMFSTPEGYVAEVLRRSCSISWVWTFVTLYFIEPLAHKLASDLPTAFFLKGTLFLMLCISSTTFFILFRGDQEEVLDMGKGR